MINRSDLEEEEFRKEQQKIKDAVVSNNGSSQKQSVMQQQMAPKQASHRETGYPELPELPEPPSPGQEKMMAPPIPPPHGMRNRMQIEKVGEPVSPGEGKPSTVEYFGQRGESYAGMQPSMTTQEQGYQQTESGYSQYPQDYYGDAYSQYEQYQPYQDTVSSDIITEISEQVVTERLERVQEQLEDAIDFKNTAETRIMNMDERLKRIEQILDRLQLSLLQKVGDYVSDVQDIKKELEETQKSFKKINPRMGKRHKSHKKTHKHKKHP